MNVEEYKVQLFWAGRCMIRGILLHTLPVNCRSGILLECLIGSAVAEQGHAPRWISRSSLECFPIGDNKTDRE